MAFFFVFLSLLFRLSSLGLMADQIFPAYAGGTFGRSNHEAKYKIEFHSSESPYIPDGDQESLTISGKKGNTFLCFLPTVEESAKSITQQNTSHIIIESDRRSKPKTPDELLDVMQDRCFLRQEGWWSYEFCYQKQLRQFHVDDDNKVVQEFILGRYDPEATVAFNGDLSDVSTLKDPRSKDASQRYHAHQYTNGTVCDLTDHPRETEVRFVCEESRAMISSVKEISTCRYAVTIQCPILCKHPMFQEETPLWHTINCNEMSKEYEDMEMKDSDKQINLVTDVEIPAHHDPEQFAT